MLLDNAAAWLHESISRWLTRVISRVQLRDSTVLALETDFDPDSESSSVETHSQNVVQAISVLESSAASGGAPATTYVRPEVRLLNSSSFSALVSIASHVIYPEPSVQQIFSLINPHFEFSRVLSPFFIFTQYQLLSP